MLCIRYHSHWSMMTAGWREAGRDVAQAFFGDVQGLTSQGSCSEGAGQFTSV